MTRVDAATFVSAATNGSAGTEPEEIYTYRDEQDVALYEVCRFPDKNFAQRRPGGLWGLGDTRRVLYRLSEVRAHIAENRLNPIYIVEGEKDANAIAARGGTATCNPMGAGEWSDDYAELLQGARRVCIVVDKDDESKRGRDGLTPGERHAREIVESLALVGLGPTQVELVQAAEGKDAYDHLRGYGLEEFVPFELPATVAGDEGERAQPPTISVYSARHLAELELPASADPLAGPFLRRGMCTLVGGPTGHGKTTFIHQMLAAAAAGGQFLGEPAAGGAHVLILDLEQHLESIQRNIRESGLDQCDSVDVAPIPEGLALDRRSDQLDALERVLAAKPYDVLAVDPFYKLHEADSSDELQARLLVALLRSWISEYGFALLSATHCRKLPSGRNTLTLDDLFGSSLFTRDPEIVLGLQRHGTLAKLHVFKSREPGLNAGQMFELIFSRERGYQLKPNVDPEERKQRLQQIGKAAVAWVKEHPGQSTNKVKQGVGSIAKCGSDLVEEALWLQVKSGLHPAPISGSRNAKLWYPPNHAALTSPESLLGEVTEGTPKGQSEPDFTGPSDFPVGESEVREGEVSEARP